MYTLVNYIKLNNPYELLLQNIGIFIIYDNRKLAKRAFYCLSLFVYNLICYHIFDIFKM